MAVFKPTGTSQAMIKAVEKYLPCDTLLDLGCGNGIIGGSLQKYVKEVYASDISQEAIDYIKLNAPYIDARQGNIFEPWQGMKFDIIVDDVSGITEEIAHISPWFNDVPCQSGKDGADLICEVLIQAPEYLEENGILFFPIVSLSNVDRIKKLANHIYEIELLSHNEFPLPKEMYKHIDLIKKVKGIELKEKYGMYLFYTDIYKAIPKKNWKAQVKNNRGRGR